MYVHHHVWSGTTLLHNYPIHIVERQPLIPKYVNQCRGKSAGQDQTRLHYQLSMAVTKCPIENEVAANRNQIKRYYVDKKLITNNTISQVIIITGITLFNNSVLK